jgi:ferredoxin
MNLEDHPTVRRLAQMQAETRAPTAPLDAEALRKLALECGAADAGVVEIGRPGLDPQRDEILRNYPWTKTLLSFVVRMAREPVRGAPRSVANLEFHRAGHEIDAIGAAIVARLEVLGIRAVNPSMGFPMEMYRMPSYAAWVVSHKPIAVEAGLGHMGIHRNLIHPKFGNFVLIGTVLIELNVETEDHPIDYNPCLECKLCVAACPVGAIGPDGSFNFSSCLTHNYREFMGGFSDWVEQVADARDALDYRKRMNEPETSSMWQSLTYGANYKLARSLPLALLRRKVVLKGDPWLLLAFGKCFPTAPVRRKPVEILPQPSLLKREPSRYLRNDPATGKIRWLGSLVLAEREPVTHNVTTFRFKSPDSGEIPFDYKPGQFLTMRVAPGGVPTKRSYTIASTPTWRDRIEIR